MNYKDIETRDYFIDGMHWYTTFLKDGDVIHTCQWYGFWGDNDVKKVIDEEILPFLRVE